MNQLGTSSAAWRRRTVVYQWIEAMSRDGWRATNELRNKLAYAWMILLLVPPLNHSHCKNSSHSRNECTHVLGNRIWTPSNGCYSCIFFYCHISGTTIATRSRTWRRGYPYQLAKLDVIGSNIKPNENNFIYWVHCSQKGYNNHRYNEQRKAMTRSVNSDIHVKFCKISILPR